jgi:hypothetical protein
MEVRTLRKQGGFWLAHSLGLILGICPVVLFGQIVGCTGREREEALPKDAKVYRDAMTLADKLDKNGVMVNCVMNSAMEGMFDGQSGAAVYRTSHGSFDVLLLAESKTFDSLKILEQRDGERYAYRFKGSPQPWPSNLIDSAYRIYFIKSGTILFVVDDGELAAMIRKGLRPQP